MTPFGGARGTEDVVAEGNGPLLETGTLSDECKMLNELAVGPNGKKETARMSEPIMQVPSDLCVVVTRRGAGRVVEAMIHKTISTNFGTATILI